ncbi:autotransporter outer membrane beta-barrel domain-containing protein [Parasutterella secunda]|uniref:autotransporter family protein n=1 Tax=Parasutterella secunda TaxID=626947 RepID=UPI0020136DFA|nr:autotransporter outer membrane beta-barrel domain-containing protein [Parasutterella secunda]MCL1597224.1 autotransporter outer membrane beta-barrel domain-containing protein [Parasutterella secunda]
MAVSTGAFASITVDRDYVNGIDSTKFIHGNGDELVIKTNGDVRKFVADIKKAIEGYQASAAGGNPNELGLINAIREALSQTNYGDNAILTGTVGGNNFIDQSTISELGEALGLISDFNQNYKGLCDAILDELNKQFKKQQKDVTSTKITIGGEGTNPFMIGTVAGDRVINAISGNSEVYAENKMESVISGNTVIEANSGNLLGLTGGSSAINISGVDISVIFPLYSFDGGDASTIVEGNSLIDLKGTTSAIGVVGSGSAIALGGKASTSVLGSTTINVNTETDSAGYEGVTAGIVGGGLAGATWGGEATAIVTDSTINLNSGASVGIIGSGAAVSGDSSAIVDAVKDFIPMGSLINVKGDNAGGTATSTVRGTTAINVSGKASSFGLVGGGLAAAHQRYDSVTDSTSTVDTTNVEITIGDLKSDIRLTNTQKREIFEDVKSVLDDLQNLDQVGEYKLLTDIVDAIDHEGVNVGVMGGGMALAYQQNNGYDGKYEHSAWAQSTVDSVEIAVNSGYNVGIFGSGLAAASAASVGDKTTNAISDVSTVSIYLNGGDTVGVMGGGISYFTGTNEPNTGIAAQAHTNTVTIQVGGTDQEGNQLNPIVDGIVGGGLAVDDSNPDSVATKNVSSEVDEVNIKVHSGYVGYLSFESFFGNNTDQPHKNTGLLGYLDSLTYAMMHNDVAIIGGGMAAGGQGASTEETGASHVETTNIYLGGTATIGEEGREGNVFAGGIASDGAWSSVKNANVIVDGATITGDVYGGGIALDGEYTDGDYYNPSKATVGNVTMTFLSGKVNGDIHAGGVVQDDDNVNKGSSSTVKNAKIMLANDQVLGDTTVVDGAGADTSDLTIVSESGTYTFADGQSVTSFDTLTAESLVKGMKYKFGDRGTTTVLGNGTIDFAELTFEAGDVLAIGNDTGRGVASYSGDISNLTLDVNNGLMVLNADSETGLSGLASVSHQYKGALYVTGTVDFSDSKALVGKVTSETNGLYLGSDGLLIADAGSQTTVTGTVDSTNGTIHFIDVAQDGAKVTIDAEADTATSVDNVLYKAIRNEDAGVYYTFNSRTGSELDEVGLGDVDDTGALGDISKQDDASSDYINDFLDQTTGGVTNSNRSQQLNAALNLAAAAGVQTVAIDSATMGIDAASQRASLIHDFAEGGVLFAEASGKRFEMGGSSDFGAIKADLGGLVVGGEYSANDWTFGALANLGTGTVRGQDDNSGIRNEVDYYGVQAYAGKRFGMMNVIGQVGYVTTSNDVSHTTVANEKADIDADVLSVGVRGEMRFDLTQNSRLVPYIGFNYLRVNTDGYNTDQGLRVKEQDQDVFTVPVGVKFAGDMQTASGWVMTPSMDIGYVHAFGDRDTQARTQVGATTAHTTMDVWAESVVRTSFGLKAQKDNWGVGVQAGTALGSDDTKELFGQVRVDYRF